MVAKMYMNLFYFVGALCYLNATTASKAPFITRCKVEDSECLKGNAIAIIPMFTAGIPELRIETTDPMKLYTINASTHQLRFILRDVEMKGLRNCQANSVRRDKDKSMLFIALECPIEIHGKYEAEGRVLSTAIEGRGDVYFGIMTAKLDLDTYLIENKGEDGKIYYSLLHPEYFLHFNNKASVEMSGLFDGNKSSSKEVEDLFRKKPNEVLSEISAPLFEMFMRNVLENIRNFFQSVPKEDLEIP